MHTLEFKTQLIDLIDNTRQLIDKKTSLVFNVITQLKEDNENLIFKFLNFCENNNIYFEKSSSTTSLSNCNLKSRNDKQNDSHLRSVNNNISLFVMKFITIPLFPNDSERPIRLMYSSLLVGIS